jgi:hypothetical protein
LRLALAFEDPACAHPRQAGLSSDKPAETADMHRFRAKLYKIGFLRCVDVPPAVSQMLDDPGAISVRGSVARIAFESTLTPRGAGRHRLYVHSRVWRPLHIDIGDSVDITIERDHESREIATPRELLRALERRPAARAAFRSSTPAQQREISMWLGAAKRPETRERRIEQALDTLEARAKPRSGPANRKRR